MNPNLSLTNNFGLTKDSPWSHGIDLASTSLRSRMYKSEAMLLLYILAAIKRQAITAKEFEANLSPSQSGHVIYSL